MSESTVTIIAAAVGSIVGLLTLLGMAVKWLLLPYLQRELFDPVRQTHHQVTVNHHSSDAPTILDRLDDVQKVAEDARDSSRKASSELTRHLVNAEEAQTEGHREAQRMWSAIEAIAKTKPPE